MRVLLINGSPDETAAPTPRLRGRPRARGERRRNGNRCISAAAPSAAASAAAAVRAKETAAVCSVMTASTKRSTAWPHATASSSVHRFTMHPRAAASPLSWIGCFTPAAGNCAARSERQSSARAVQAQPLRSISFQKYFAISGMPIAPSQYWPMVHGNTPEEVKKDEEGLQIMRTLGRYMAYMIKSFALARENGLLPPPQEEPRRRTNFIR